MTCIDVFIVERLNLTDAPLTPGNVHEVVRTITRWQQFCRYLQISDNPNSKMKTLTFFIQEPYFEASWKKIALALYHTCEERDIDVLFQYMKSPSGQLLS